MRDEQAIQRYVDMLYDFGQHIVVFCRKHGKNEVDCELLYDAILEALQHSIDGLNPASTLRQRRAWLKKLMWHAFVDHRRRPCLHTLPFDEENYEANDYDHELLESLLEHLTPDERLFLEQRFEGRTPDEQAAQLGVTRDVVYQRYHRIVLKLRNIYYRLYADK